MANKIGSNFLLPAKVFLDKRQGIVSGIGELGTWDYDKYPIPDGFEVFVDGKWYTYYKDIKKDSITGFFRIRGGINVLQTTGSSEDDVMSQNAVTNALNGLNERIQDIIHSLGTVLEIRLLPDYTISGNPTVDGGLYENGTRIQPSFAWEVWYNGMKLKRKDVSVSIYINGSFYSGGMNNPSEDEDEYTWVWIYDQNISRDTVITLSVLYGNGSSSDSIGSVSISKNITYEFINSRIWGKSKTNDISKILIDGKTYGNRSLSKERSIVLNNVDCSVDDEGNDYTSGLYIYYMIPTEIYGEVNESEDPIRLLTGNMENNAFSCKFGEEDYSVIVFDYPQTGVLNIEFK